MADRLPAFCSSLSGGFRIVNCVRREKSMPRILRFAVACFAIALVAVPANAQEKPTLTVYTYSGFPSEYGPGGTIKARFAEVFKTKTRDEWTTLMAHEDACVMPVLTLGEAMAHPHNRARQAFTEQGGVAQVAPAPRFSRTAPALDLPPPHPGEHSTGVLAELGFSAREIDALLAEGTVAQTQ